MKREPSPTTLILDSPTVSLLIILGGSPSLHKLTAHLTNHAES